MISGVKGHRSAVELIPNVRSLMNGIEPLLWLQPRADFCDIQELSCNINDLARAAQIRTEITGVGNQGPCRWTTDV